MNNKAAFYKGWGFRDNPFYPQPLGGDETGLKLLVGRADELKSVKFSLKFGGQAVCLDGPVGVGKTSLANVAAYSCELDHYQNPQESPLLIPCRSVFQINKDESPSEFKNRVLLEVAQTLIQKSKNFQSANLPSSHALDQWLNSPTFRQIEGQILGFGGGGTSSPNESSGFSESGFAKLVTEWLEANFPDKSTGGIVCVIDNLELLETSKAARHTIEDLRDSLFSMHGVRWVICGAHGIVQGVVASPRLTGYLGEPLPVTRLKLQRAQEIFSSREEHFRDFTQSELYLPIVADDFHQLYMILGENLRQSLAMAHSYCLSVAMSGQAPTGDEAKKERFKIWLKSNALATKSSSESHIGQTAIDLLKRAINEFQGEFTPSDCKLLGFKSIQSLRPHVKSLEDCGLVEATRDESDQRRRTITVTGKGWLVDYAYRIL